MGLAGEHRCSIVTPIHCLLPRHRLDRHGQRLASNQNCGWNLANNGFRRSNALGDVRNETRREVASISTFGWDVGIENPDDAFLQYVGTWLLSWDASAYSVLNYSIPDIHGRRKVSRDRKVDVERVSASIDLAGGVMFQTNMQLLEFKLVLLNESFLRF